MMKQNVEVVVELERCKETADSEVWTASKARPDTVVMLYMCGLGQWHWDSGAVYAELEGLAKHFKVQKPPGPLFSDWICQHTERFGRM